MNVEQLGQYAPYILIAIAFISSYKIFVTPDMLDKKLKEYVLKETYNVTIAEMKNDILEIKSTLSKIYDKIMKE